MDALTDTHCHLDFEAFDPDRAAVLARAADTGVIRTLIPGLTVESATTALGIARTSESVFVAAGVHPNSVMTWNPNSRAELAALAVENKVVAIGEIGLDYYRDYTPRSAQLLAFQEQLELAAELNLPVVLHNREATDDLLDVLTDWHANLVKSGSKLTDNPGVLHSYSGDSDQAQRALALNFYIGITGPVTFRNAPELQQVVAGLPLDRILIETDAPFLAPHPVRGQRNEPAYVRLVAEKIAALHGITYGEVCMATTENAGRLLGW